MGGLCMDDRVKNMDDSWRESKQEFADAIVLISLNSNKNCGVSFRLLKGSVPGKKKKKLENC